MYSDQSLPPATVYPPILPDNLRELNQMTERESKLRRQAEGEILLGQLQLQQYSPNSLH